MTVQNDFGLIGLAVMGQNLVLNVESRGFAVSVFNRTARDTRGLRGRAPGQALTGHATPGRLRASLSRPRKVMLMVKAGAAVDAVIEQLLPLLEPATSSSTAATASTPTPSGATPGSRALGLRFIGAGVSGGEEGARKGPSIMPGGPASTWEVMRPSSRPSPRRWTASPASSTSARRRRPLREDGPQRHRIRRHAAHLRGLRAASGRRLTTDEMAAMFDQWNRASCRAT
jgi:6-phosphogluconate dehydrogenase